MKLIYRIALINNYLMAIMLTLSTIIFSIERFNSGLLFNNYVWDKINELSFLLLIGFLISFLISIITKNLFWYRMNKSHGISNISNFLFLIPIVNLIVPNILFSSYLKKKNSKLFYINILMNFLVIISLLLIIVSINEDDAYFPYFPFTLGCISIFILLYLFHKIDTNLAEDEINLIGKL